MLRVQEQGAQAVQTTQENPSSTRVHNGTLSINARTGEMHSTGLTRVTATFERHVDVGGIKTTREVAERMGLIEPEGAAGAAQAPAAAEQTPAVTPPAIPEGPALEAEYAESREVLRQGVPASVMDALVKHISEDNTGNLAQFTRAGAEAMGVERGAFEATLRHAITGHQMHADAALKRKGIEPTEFYAYAKANHPRELHAAMRQHWHTGSADSYAVLAEKFIRAPQNTPDESTLEANGIKTWRDPSSRKLMVDIGGMAVSLKVAMHNGWIRPSV